MGRYAINTEEESFQPTPITLFSTATHIFVSTPGIKPVPNQLTWDSSYIGEISEYVSLVPRTIIEKIVHIQYTDGSYDYGILEPYNDNDFMIEIIKFLFKIPRREFHLCLYKKRKYFLFLSYPEKECSISLTKLKVNNITLNIRIMIMFLWIFGLKGKLWMRGDIVYTRRHSQSDFQNNDMSAATRKKCFRCQEDVLDSINIFKDNEKCYNLSLLIGDNIMYSLIKSRMNNIC